MSDEPKRRETAEGKEERRREIEGLIESMNRTAPKAAGVTELPVKTLSSDPFRPFLVTVESIYASRRYASY
jgi:hypothetical protein